MPSVPAYEQLLAWFYTHDGELNPRLQLTESSDRGIYLRARRDLPRQDASKPRLVHICTSPPSSCLSFLNILPRQRLPGGGLGLRSASSVLTPVIDIIPHHVLSRFVLIEQHLLQLESFWYPYINSLPKAHRLNTPLFFSVEDLGWLKDTNVYAASKERREDWEQEWRDACNSLRTNHVDATPFTWELYAWAATMFSSRGFLPDEAFRSFGEFSVLWPVVDSLNHSGDAKVNWEYSGDHSFSLYTNDEVQAGEEVYNNYGPKGNEELLLGYGFCIPNNPYDQVAVKLRLPGNIITAIEHADANPYGLEDTPPADTIYIRSTGCRFGRYANIVPCLRGIPPAMVRFALETYLLSYPTRPKDLSKPTGRIHFGVLRRILAPVQSKIMGLASSQPPYEPRNENQRLAQTVRDSQTEILTEIYAEIKKTLDSITFMDDSVPGSVHSEPILISAVEALLQLQSEAPEAYPDFVKGASVFVDVEDSKLVRSEDSEDMLWMLWLSYTQVWAHELPPQQSSIIKNWLQDLQTAYGIPEPVSIDAQDQTFQYIKSIVAQAAEAAPGSTVWEKLDSSNEYSAWAAKVVPLEAWQQPSKQDPRLSTWLMYMRQPGYSEDWMFAESRKSEEDMPDQ